MTFSLTRRQTIMLSACAAALPMLGACGSKPAGNGADQVTLMFDWVFEGLHAAFFYGLEKGIFARHKIDLTLLPGTGSRNAALAVAAGHTTFSMVDATVMPQAVLQGTDLKAIYCFMPTTPFGVCYKKSAGIAVPTDLAGHTYGDSPGAATYVLWALFMKKLGVDPKTIKLVNISPSSQWAAFRNGEFDATYTAMNNSFVKVSRSDPGVGAFPYAEHDFNILSKCIVAKPSTVANGDLMARFAAAVTEAVDAAKGQRDAAIDTLRKSITFSTPREEQRAMLDDTLDKRITSPSTAGKPLGWMPEADWQNVIDIIGQTTPDVKRLKLADLFTNEFIRG
ncbi:ABC transporter substrate-binding protein [Novosphingobium album (ex Liu et al. 2023)]|uniref:ABC transporter substrate-binding protein n=1 Tax=Novosphingobium album (ex Liu et al. 2023) TaxID=3031130 RepID=A0ABT5WNA4_9SPHN|nr:ABC transporter substrate-binding protein [Novosphingobium album (ex Liu et al. 2023)]MDE8651526.1 ABC transporter substrate-binding protein [Novosphingobium album (ex Liu et al. 2023)]